MALNTPTVDRVMYLDGLYADERELTLAALADDLSVNDAIMLVENFKAERDEEWAAQQEAEIAAENAWLRHAESAGWEDALEDEAREARGF